MPSKKQYNLVQNDDYDTRIPLHSDEAFHHGINFQAKYIGTLDVPRPTSRVEIVAAMRRIRYEFKAKGIKKKKVIVEVSVEGVRVSLRKKKKKQWLDDSNMLLMQHPIYRIFYVSHDSQDLKIFSYIARDGSSNVFKCNVFKSNKKSQAMRIVRTVGQAFEVCHKLSINAPSPDEERDAAPEGGSERDSEPASDKPRKDTLSDPLSCDTLANEDTASLQDTHSDSVPAVGGHNTGTGAPQAQRPLRLDILPPPPGNTQSRRSPMSGVGETYTSPLSEPLRGTTDAMPSAGTPLSAHHELQLLREQLEQQAQQTQAAVAQVHLLRDQLAAETAARLEAQARTHQLLVHNKELLDHISTLVLHLQEQERRNLQGGGSGQLQPSQLNTQSSHVTMVPQMTAVLCDPQTPASLGTPMFLPDFSGSAAAAAAAAIENQFLAPSSPQRHSMLEHQFQQQLMQRLQGLSGYGQPRPPPYALASLYPPPPTTSLFPPSQPLSFQTSPVMPHRQISVVEDPNPHLIRPLEPEPVASSASGSTSKESASGSPSAKSQLTSAMVTLRVDDTTSSPRRTTSMSNGPPFITRTTSEKVPNRSELMSQVQRTVWARHTTK